jgi:sensor histidine kinase YesM
MVPILSIEPFIENAIKYSRIQGKEDGYIELSTSETDNHYIIKVSDNGVGFSKEELAKSNSQGIKNALSRFEFLLRATTRVVSKPNKGTSIEISIPKAGR